MREPLRVGAVVDSFGTPFRSMLEIALRAEKLGMDAVWLAQMPNQMDVGTALAGLAVATERIGLGTGILPMYSRPAVVMAQSAMTADELSGGRVSLGLGLGHREVGDWMVGAKPAPALPSTREYLTIVTSLLRDGAVSFDGTFHSGHASYGGQRRDDQPVLLGAFGPKLLELAGELADGAILWMCSADYVREQAIPALRRGWAKRGGRPDGFRVVAMMHAGVTPEPDNDRAQFGRLLSSYLRVGTYRKLFTASGFTAAVESGRPDERIVAELAAFGEDEVAARITALRDCGVDEIAVAPAGTAHQSFDRCVDTLAAVHGIAAGLGAR